MAEGHDFLTVDTDFDELFARCIERASSVQPISHPDTTAKTGGHQDERDGRVRPYSKTKPASVPQAGLNSASAARPRRLKSVVTIPEGSGLRRTHSVAMDTTPVSGSLGKSSSSTVASCASPSSPTLSSVLAARPRRARPPSPSHASLPPTLKPVSAYGETFAIPIKAIQVYKKWKAWHPAGKVVFLFDKHGNVRRTSLLRDKEPPAHAR